MTVTAKIMTFAAIGGIAGTIILLATDAPGLGGALLGAAIAALAGAVAFDTGLKQLNAEARELRQRRQQYEAAYSTLASQRHRMRTEFEEQIAEYTDTLNAAHQEDLSKSRREWFEEGFITAITGRLDEPEGPAEAPVIRLNTHRRRITQNAGRSN